MRIIAGTRRSLPLKSIPGQEIRPTTDRIKETLFNILRDEIPGCYFLDLFAGTGQIGLEALSRGAIRAVFVENDRKHMACIEENIRFTKFTEESETLLLPVEAALGRLEGRRTFGVIFLDPPYGSDLTDQTLRLLSRSSVVRPDTLIIAEAAKEKDFGFAEGLGLTVTREKVYKTNKHVFIRRTEP